jgi:hypothetical protein
MDLLALFELFFQLYSSNPNEAQFLFKMLRIYGLYHQETNNNSSKSDTHGSGRRKVGASTISVVVFIFVAIAATAVLLANKHKDLAGAVRGHPQTALGIPGEAGGTEAVVGAVGKVRVGENIDGGVPAAVVGRGLAVVAELDAGDAVADGFVSVP